MKSVEERSTGCFGWVLQVVKRIQELTVYTEFLDRNSSRDLQSTEEEMTWKLARDKMPYNSSKDGIQQENCQSQFPINVVSVKILLSFQDCL